MDDWILHSARTKLPGHCKQENAVTPYVMGIDLGGRDVCNKQQLDLTDDDIYQLMEDRLSYLIKNMIVEGVKNVSMYDVEREVVSNVREVRTLDEDMIVYKKGMWYPSTRSGAYDAIIKLKIPAGTTVVMPTILDKTAFTRELLFHTYAKIEELAEEAKFQAPDRDRYFYSHDMDELISIVRGPEHYRKCRAEKAEVVSIVGILGVKQLGAEKEDEILIEKAMSTYDSGFEYIVGETVRPTEDRPFCDDIDVCASGIHFFLTEEEARDYDF